MFMYEFDKINNELEAIKKSHASKETLRLVALAITAAKAKKEAETIKYVAAGDKARAAVKGAK